MSGRSGRGSEEGGHAEHRTDREDGRHRVGREDPVDAEIRAELEAHFEGTVDLLVARGWAEEDARAEAARRFGNVERYRARLERLARRSRRRASARGLVLSIGSALRSALRDLVRAPGLSFAVIVTLALGIGANAAVFRVADRLLLSPPEHVARPDEVVRLHQTLLLDDGPHILEAFTYPDVRELRASGLPARVAASIVGMPETLGDGQDAIRVRVARVDSAFLPVVGVDVALGRALTPDDHRADAPPVALLGHGVWTARFGADPSVLGRTLRVGTSRVDVVGVLPEGFVGTGRPAVDVWLPLESTAGELWGETWASETGRVAFRVLARVDPGAAVPTLTEGAASVLRGSRGDDWAIEGELLSVGTASLVPGDAPYAGAVVSISRWLAGVALLVLLVACANVANLFLAHGERARRETAVRRALGAGRARVGGELLVRTLVLALLGAGAAWLVTTWGGRALDDLFLVGMELGARPRDGRLVVFVAVAALAAAILAGLGPAVLSSRGGLRASLAGEGRGSTGSGRLRWTLVSVQAALSALLVVGALLFVSSLRAALRIDLGFDPERLLMVRIEADEGPAEALLYADAERALTGTPGVASAAATVGVPFVLLYGLQVRLPGGAPPPGMSANAVGEGFLRTMGVPLLRGRDLGRGDFLEGAEPVAIVDSVAATRLWPREDALGQCLVVDREEGACARIVGIARQHAGTWFSQDDPAARATMMAWVPLPVADRAPSALMVRTDGPAASAAASVRRRVGGLPGVRYAEVEPMTSFVEQQTRSWRLGAIVLSLFGAIALGVAVVGLYGVLSYDLSRRRRDIGIRIALGAPPRRVLGGVAGPGLAAVGAGLGLALPLAGWAAGRLGPLLYGVSPREPVVFAAAGCLLLATGALATSLPALRATRVDPREALSDP